MWGKRKNNICRWNQWNFLGPNDTNSTQLFVGFCIDILLDLADRLNFTFEIEIVKDRTFGKKNEKGEWNGIIGELVHRVSNHFFSSFLTKLIIRLLSESRFRSSWINNHVSTWTGILFQSSFNKIKFFFSLGNWFY